MSRFRRNGRVPWVVLGAMGALLALLLAATPAAAETGTRALVLDSSVEGGASSIEATEAAANGFTVDVVDETTWAAMTKDGFAEYQMVIVGDPDCGSLSPVVSQNAQALADAVMDNDTANTRSGNRVLIGTDPDYHSEQGGSKMIASAIDFASVVDGATSLYLNFTCGDPDNDTDGTGDGQQKLLPLLSFDPAPTWSQNTDPPCGGDVSLIANNDQFASLTSTDIRNWGCSVHETFPQYPTDWNPLAIATDDVLTKPTCGNDVDTGEPACGEAYLLIAGSGIVATAPDLALEPPTATRDAGTPHTVTATVTRTDKTPRPGVTVSFVVTGVNSGASGTCAPVSCESDADGKVTFTYTGTNLGDDTINASMTVDGSRQTATAAVTWVTPPAPTPTPTASPTPVPTVEVEGDVQRSCSGKRRFRVVLRNQSRIRYRSATFTLDGKKIKARRFGGRIGTIVDLRKMRRRAVTLRIRAVTSKGDVLKGKRVYHPCTKKIKKKRPPKL